MDCKKKNKIITIIFILPNNNKNHYNVTKYLAFAYRKLTINNKTNPQMIHYPHSTTTAVKLKET